MRQSLHLLLVDPQRGTALAAWYGSRWILPVLSCGERARAGPLAHRWAVDRGLAGEVVGQWLGRVSRQGVDWLVVLRADGQPTCNDPQLTWTRLALLCPSCALIDYQAWCVDRALGGRELPQVPGPFGSIFWIDEVRAWISRHCGCSRPELTALRTGAYEVVVRAATPAGNVYFKGLTGHRASEAVLTQALAAHEPESFAMTIGAEARTGALWWLTAGCPGHPPEDDRVGVVLARLQQRLMAPADLRDHLCPLEFDAMERWAADLDRDGRVGLAVRECVRTIGEAKLPVTWVPMDLDPTNVLIDAAGKVRFIDLDESYHGPAPLAVSVLATRLRRTSLRVAYENAWPEARAGVEWPDIERAARIIEAWLGWRRFVRCRERGEIACPVDLVARRIVDRLRLALQRG